MALAEFVVAFREVFEIALVLGIMLAYLGKTKGARHAKFVYLGALVAVAASIGAAYAFESLAGGFEANEAIFEGITLVLAAVLVTWLNFWMVGQANVRKGIERGVSRHAASGAWLSLAAFSFIAVFREGVEMVLFLNGIAITTGTLSLAWAAAGGVAAVLLSYAVLRQLVKLDMKKFFLATSVMLAVLAAGLLSQGVHELQEAAVIPTSIEHVYNITPPLNADGSYPLMHEKGAIGGILKGLFGYDTAPSLEQVLAYFGYLAGVYIAYRRVSRH